MTQNAPINAIVLAAGKGTRMKSEHLKVIHKVGGKPIVCHVIESLKALLPQQLYIVVGHQKDTLIKHLSDSSLTYVEQAQQLGTGHAVQQVDPVIKKDESITLILAGDCPLIKTDTLQDLIQNHLQSQADASILTTIMPIPTGYGRIIRNEQNQIIAIREEKDCSEKERLTKEINSGIYAFNTKKLFSHIQHITTNNKQAEYYLTDVIGLLQKEGSLIESVCTQTPHEVIGINTRKDLATINTILYQETNERLMREGVTILSPETTFIDSTVSIGHDTIIHPHCIISGNTTIGSHCEIGPFSQLTNQTIPHHQTYSHTHK